MIWYSNTGRIEVTLHYNNPIPITFTVAEVDTVSTKFEQLQV